MFPTGTFAGQSPPQGYMRGATHSPLIPPPLGLRPLSAQRGEKGEKRMWCRWASWSRPGRGTWCWSVSLTVHEHKATPCLPPGRDGWGALQGMLRGLREQPVDQELTAALWPEAAGERMFSTSCLGAQVHSISTACTRPLSAWGAFLTTVVT